MLSRSLRPHFMSAHTFMPDSLKFCFVFGLFNGEKTRPIGRSNGARFPPSWLSQCFRCLSWTTIRVRDCASLNVCCPCPGQLLSHGQYRVIYVAVDAANNSVTCSFKLFIASKSFFRLIIAATELAVPTRIRMLQLRW